MESQQVSPSTAWTTKTPSHVAVTDDATNPTSSPLCRRNMTPDKRSSTSVNCRICHEDGNLEELIDPCECSGTLGLIHTSCLEKWLSTSNTDRCEICKYAFVIQKKNKPLSQSLWQWWRSKNIHGPQGVAGDVICLIVLTPLCVAATYLCGVGASAYTRLGFWEGTGLAVLCCMLVATYCLWLIVTIRFHFKSWKNWCKRNQDVKLIVKHKSEKYEGSADRETQVKTYWVISQDSNNNSSGDNNRFGNWLFASFANNEDSLYPLRQQTTAV